MRKLTITLAAAALALGSMVLSVSAQTQQPGAASLHTQAQAACRGFGRHCPPGSRWVCGPAHCWCAPC
jgi:Spy/CpxP family protein refolding chaperone